MNVFPEVKSNKVQMLSYLKLILMLGFVCVCDGLLNPVTF